MTVLFADLKGSTELIRDLDPKEVQRLLDPTLHVMMDAMHCAMDMAFWLPRAEAILVQVA